MEPSNMVQEMGKATLRVLLCCRGIGLYDIRIL